MKKLLFILMAGSIVLAACRKQRDDVVSEVVPVSFPTITFSGGQYFSIPVGGTVPTIAATAYDSVLGSSTDVTLTGQAGIDASTPGLYVVTAESANVNTFSSISAAFVLVSDVPAAFNLAGEYLRTTGEPVNVTRLANGLYMTDDVGGAAALEVAAVFGHIRDTVITLPLQPTSNGDLDCINERLIISGGDTSLSWAVRGTGFGTAQRTFLKQ